MTTPDKPIVELAERTSGDPEAIKRWFYPGDNTGWEFVYPKSNELEAAAVVPPPAAPAPPPAAEPPAPEVPVELAAEPPVVAVERETLVAQVELTPDPVEDGQPQAERVLPETAGYSAAFLFGGIATVGFGLADKAQRTARKWLDQTVRTRQMASKGPKPDHLSRHGDVLGRLTIPRLNVSVMVFEGDDARILKEGAGHIPATSLPNQNGNLGIAAHRDTYFRPLRRIHPNDVIEFATPEGVSRYTVTDTEIVQPSDIQVLAKAPGRDLTLVTCYPFYYLGSAPKRWIVHAKRVA